MSNNTESPVPSVEHYKHIKIEDLAVETAFRHFSDSGIPPELGVAIGSREEELKTVLQCVEPISLRSPIDHIALRWTYHHFFTDGSLSITEEILKNNEVKMVKYLCGEKDAERFKEEQKCQCSCN